MLAPPGPQAMQSEFLNGTEEFASLLAGLRVAQWQYGPAKNTLTWQRSFFSTTDRETEYSTEPMDAVLERFSPDERAHLLKHFETALREGRAGPTRFSVVTRQGKRSFIESAAFRVMNPDGHASVCGIYRNCAVDVEAEYSLREATGLLGRLTGASPSAVLVIDNQGGIRSVNQQFCRVFRLPADHGVVGRNIRNIPNRLGKALVSTLLSLLELGGQDVHNQKKFILPDGSELLLTYRTFRYGAGLRSGGLVFKADLDSADEVNMGSLFDHLPTPMIAIHLETRHIVAANAMARRYFGLRKEHIKKEDITGRILQIADLRAMMETINSLGIENGHVCTVKSLLGESQTYRLRALPYSDNDRRLLVLEFHPSKQKKQVGSGDEPVVHRKGLLKRVVEHLDF